MKKFFSFFVIVAYVFGTIGCAAYLFFYHLPQFGVASILLSLMAFPYFKKHLDNMLS